MLVSYMSRYFTSRDVKKRYVRALEATPCIVYKWVEVDDVSRTIREGVCEPGELPDDVRAG